MGKKRGPQRGPDREQSSVCFDQQGFEEQRPSPPQTAPSGVTPREGCELIPVGAEGPGWEGAPSFPDLGLRDRLPSLSSGEKPRSHRNVWKSPGPADRSVAMRAPCVGAAIRVEGPRVRATASTATVAVFSRFLIFFLPCVMRFCAPTRDQSNRDASFVIHWRGHGIRC